MILRTSLPHDNAPPTEINFISTLNLNFITRLLKLNLKFVIYLLFRPYIYSSYRLKLLLFVYIYYISQTKVFYIFIHDQGLNTL